MKKLFQSRSEAKKLHISPIKVNANIMSTTNIKKKRGEIFNSFDLNEEG